jgi:predicted enzyme related to lactoylglutathione lyase
MDRAKKFYGEVLGLEKTSEYEGKWCEFDTPEGKAIALDTFSPEGTPPYLSLETNNIEAEVSRLKEAGVEVLMDVRDNKVCKMAIIKDPEWNGIMLHEIAPERAK